MFIIILGVRWAEIGDEYHILQFICTIKLGRGWWALYDFSPSIRPIVIMMGARYLK